MICQKTKCNQAVKKKNSLAIYWSMHGDNSGTAWTNYYFNFLVKQLDFNADATQANIPKEAMEKEVFTVEVLYFFTMI